MKELRGFGPLGLLAFAAIIFGNFLFLPLSALLVLAWARLSGTPWREIGYVSPRNWAVTAIAGVLLGIALKIAMKAVVMPLFGSGSV